MASTVGTEFTVEHELVRKANWDLSEEKKRHIVYNLLGIRKGKKLPRGSQTKLANDLGVHKSTIN